MSFVLDCSAILCAFFPDEIDHNPELLEDISAQGAVVPQLWWIEVVNGLLMGERRKRFDRKRRLQFMEDITLLPLETDCEINEKQWFRISELATEHNLTTYDATYLELCLRRNLPLATRDKALKKAAKKCGIKLYVI